MENPTQRFLTAQQVADRWQTCRTTVYRHIKAGRLPSKRLGVGGRMIRIDAEDVEAFEREANDNPLFIPPTELNQILGLV